MKPMRMLGAVAAAATLISCAAASSPVTQPSAAPSPSQPASAPSASPPTAPPTTVRPSAEVPTSAPPTVSPSRPTGTLPAWLAGPSVTRLPTNRHVVALTFDGGSGAQGATAILHTLRTAGVPATFFLTGQFVRTYPALTAAILDGGYLIGNHTMTHPHLTRLSNRAVVEEVTTAEQRLEAAIGDSPRPWFRFPFGEYDPRTLRVVHSLGYGAIGWTVDTRGWQGHAAGTVNDVVARVKAALQPGAIVLMHLGANPDDSTTLDADALAAVITTVRAAGYTFVALDE